MNWFAMSRDLDIKDIMGLNCPSSTVLVPLFPLMLEVRSCHFASVKLILDVTAGDRDKQSCQRPDATLMTSPTFRKRPVTLIHSGILFMP